jgi:hypothetical protein
MGPMKLQPICSYALPHRDPADLVGSHMAVVDTLIGSRREL